MRGAALQVQGRGGSSKEMEKEWPVRWEENQERVPGPGVPRKKGQQGGGSDLQCQMLLRKQEEDGNLTLVLSRGTSPVTLMRAVPITGAQGPDQSGFNRELISWGGGVQLGWAGVSREKKGDWFSKCWSNCKLDSATVSGMCHPTATTRMKKQEWVTLTEEEQTGSKQDDAPPAPTERTRTAATGKAGMWFAGKNSRMGLVLGHRAQKA